MDRKIENKATVILLEILGILGVDSLLKVIREGNEEAELITDPKEKEKAREQLGYFMINYLFKNIRAIQPQLEELIEVLLGKEQKDISILKGIAMLKNDKEVVSFFTESLGEVMRSV